MCRKIFNNKVLAVLCGTVTLCLIIVMACLGKIYDDTPIHKNMALTQPNEDYWLPEKRNQSVMQHIYIYAIRNPD